MNAKREKHTSQKMSKKSLQGVLSETPPTRQDVITLDVKKRKKPSASASAQDAEIKSYSVKEPQSSTPRYYFDTNIPDRYNETYIIAIPKDPNWLYVYWEFSDETAHLMDSNLEQTGSKLVLRLKETEVAETYEEIMPFQVEVNDAGTGQYVPMPESSREFQIECGYFSEKDGFFPIIKSDPVTIPQSETGGQIFDLFASEEEKRTALFDTLNELQVEPTITKQTEFFNSQTCSPYSKPFPGSAGSIF